MMFSGIIREIGTVEKLSSRGEILEITISSKELINDHAVGDSIAIDGCCQTIIEVTQQLFKVQATQETLQRTNFGKLKVGSRVNLESSLKLGDKIDGHLVSGHIDSTGEIEDISSFDTTNNQNTMVKISFPERLTSYIAEKGSIAINGVSLTVASVEKSKKRNFSFSLIPYTRDNTNLGLLKIGDLVNLEVDLISRYLVNYLQNNLQLVKR